MQHDPTHASDTAPPTPVTIGNVTLGGHVGEHPTCMIGTMFYKSHKIIKDAENGIFDKDRARMELGEMEAASRDTGIPFIVDVVGTNASNLATYCQFIADAVEDKRTPFLLDGLNDEMRLDALRVLVDAGLRDRVIYNSIEPKVTEETVAALATAGARHAMLLAFDSVMLLPRQKMQLLDGWDDRLGMKEGLLPKARRAGIENALIDVAVLDMPSIGIAARAIQDVRRQRGLPAGCAPSNAIFDCEGIKQRGLASRATSLAASCAFLAASGAAFILFGPVKYARETFEAVANVNAFQAYAARRIDKIKPRSEAHPLFKMF